MESEVAGEPANADPPPGESPTEEEPDASTDTPLTLPRSAGQFLAGESVPLETTAPAFKPLSRPPAHLEHGPLFSVWTILLSLVCLALGGLGGYLLPKGLKPPAGNAAPGGFPEDLRLLTPADHDELDAAYATRHRGNYAEAERLFADLGRKHPNWGVMDVEVGFTKLYENNLDEARTRLKAAADRGLSSADANYILGAVYIKEKNYSQAESSFEKAVALDPSRPEFYYLWGECLRDEGKPLEAASRFRSAMLRNQYETNSGLFRLKLWLSEIEADRENSDGSGAEIDAALAQPRPPMEAFLAAAARDLKANDFKAAASHLLRARRHLDPIVFQIVMADPTFASVRSRPELAEVFYLSSPAPGPGTSQTVSAPASSAPGNASRPAPSPPFSAPPAKGK